MMRRLARIAVCVTVLGAAVWLWSVTSQQMPHHRRAGGDVDVRADASVPQHSATSNVAAALRLELPPMRRAVAESESRELPALRDIQLPRGSGGGAEALASDGISLWIASQFQNTVTRVRASDGKTLETVSVGSQPVAVLADPSGIWVANLGDDTVTQLDPSDGSMLGTFPVGHGPGGLVSGGNNIWVLNRNDSTVTKLARDGTTLATFRVGTRPTGAAWDGVNLWVANNMSDTVTKLDGAVLATYATGAGPFGVTSDGAAVWVANFASASVSTSR